MNNGKKYIVDQSKLIARYDEETLKKIMEVKSQLLQFLKAKDYKSIIEYGQAEIKNIPEEALGEGNTDISEIYSLTGTALLQTAGDKDRALELAMKAAEFDRTSKSAMWLIREIDNRMSDKSHYYRMQVIGTMYIFVKDEVIDQPFRTIYGVCAETPEEAMEFICRFERKEVNQNLEMLKYTDTGSRPELPKGVYETMRLIVQVDENQEDNEDDNILEN